MHDNARHRAGGEGAAPTAAAPAVRGSGAAARRARVPGPPQSHPAHQEQPMTTSPGPSPSPGSAWLPPEQFAETLPKATVFGSVFFTDERDHPLHLRAVYSSTHPWQWPGGTTEAGERPWRTAVRECEEETGIVVSGPPRLLAAVFGLPGAPWPYATAGYVFDGGRLTDQQIKEIRLAPEEHDEYRVLPLPQWRPLMPARDFDRLRRVMEARRTGRAAYIGAWDWED
ncbi:NUDIX domain-containing protein [Streptomyces sp. CA-252508]|uniref:NUDIX domain-containing protein n=1 Tax=Streptomyces sp. CA-252508 TaxID=3418946 RepID=UPI003D8DD40E